MQLAGVIIAPVAVLFMVYALYRYKRRTQQVPVLQTSPADASHAGNGNSRALQQQLLCTPCMLSVTGLLGQYLCFLPVRSSRRRPIYAALTPVLPVQILRRTSQRYDDQTGPVLLVLLLIAATVAALALTAQGTSF